MSDDEELPLHEMASSIGLSTSSVSLLTVFSAALGAFLLEEVL